MKITSYQLKTPDPKENKQKVEDFFRKQWITDHPLKRKKIRLKHFIKQTVCRRAKKEKYATKENPFQMMMIEVPIPKFLDRFKQNAKQS